MKRAYLVMVALLVSGAVFAGLTSSVGIKTYSLQTGTAVGDNTPEDRYSYSVTTSFTDGTGDGEAQLVYKASFSVGAGKSTTYNLFSGLSDAFGNALSFSAVKSCVIYNQSASQTLTVGSGTLPLMLWSNISTSTITVRPKGSILYLAPYTGYTVASSTACKLRIENNAGATCTGRLYISGI